MKHVWKAEREPKPPSVQKCSPAFRPLVLPTWRLLVKFACCIRYALPRRAYLLSKQHFTTFSDIFGVLGCLKKQERTSLLVEGVSDKEGKGWFVADYAKRGFKSRTKSDGNTCETGRETHAMSIQASLGILPAALLLGYFSAFSTVDLYDVQ